MNKKPFENAPISELQKRLYGEPRKRYDHLIICSGDWYKPIGTPGCCCRLADKTDNIKYYVGRRLK
jgi:hypothetical protein